MSLHFNNLPALHWLWAVLAVALIVGWGLHARRRRLLRFAADPVLGRLVAGLRASGRPVRAALLLAALLLLVMGLLDPRWGITYQEVQQRGIDLMMVLDVSRSMLAEDVRPNRLERARQYIGDLVEQLGGDRVGLIAAAGTASVTCPLTVDYGAFALSLEETGPEIAGRGGSLLGDAIRLAGRSFTDDVKDYKAVVLFTDGEDHDSYPLEAARQLWEERGIRVYTVGMGDPVEGARIPVEKDGQRVFLVHEGQQIWSRMNADLLQDMALGAGGAYIPAGTSNVDMAELYTQRIAPVTRREFGTTHIERREPRFQWFAGLALALLLVESAIGDTTGASRRRSRAGSEVPA